jgi:hypothetical protein
VSPKFMDSLSSPESRSVRIGCSSSSCQGTGVKIRVRLASYDNPFARLRPGLGCPGTVTAAASESARLRRGGSRFVDFGVSYES